MSEGRFTLHVYVYLTDAQRRKLLAAARTRDVEVSEIASEALARYLDELPELPPEPPHPTPEEIAHELAQRRAELARIRARRAAEGRHAPAWIDAYIADLESEIRRLEIAASY